MAITSDDIRHELFRRADHAAILAAARERQRQVNVVRRCARVKPQEVAPHNTESAWQAFDTALSSSRLTSEAAINNAAEMETAAFIAARCGFADLAAQALARALDYRAQAW